MSCRHGQRASDECLRCEHDFLEVQLITLQSNAHRPRDMAQRYAALHQRLDDIERRLSLEPQRA